MHKNNQVKQAEGDAFGCQLFYFLMKTLTVYLLWMYKSPLHEDIIQCAVYTTLLFLNSYLILTIGHNPGYAKRAEEDEQSFATAMNKQLCEICQCRKKLRMKHCYSCQKCVFKYDHHCPWIGACVGEYNQGDFWIFTLVQSIQAIWTLQLFIQTRWQYSYTVGDQYSGEYGALTILMIFMVLYSLFAVGLFIFHSFLIIVNQTSEEFRKGKKLEYMRVNSSPFNYGICYNLKSVLLHNRQNPIEWRVQESPIQQQDFDNGL